MTRTWRKKTTGFFVLILLALTVFPMCKKNAEAAEKFKMNLSTFTLYLDEDNPGNVPTTKQLSILSTPANFKDDYTVKWSAKDSTIVDVDAGSKSALIKAQKVGKTDIVCVITKNTDPSKSYTLKSEVTVKVSTKEIAINNAPENNIMYVGDVFDFNRTMTPVIGSTASDKTEWVISSDTALASVISSTGKVTALKPGTFQIKACAYRNEEAKAAEDWSAISAEVEIVIKNKITEAAATKLTQLKVVFAFAASTDYITHDYTVRNNATEQRIYILSQKLSEDKKTVLLNLSEPLTYGGSYTVTCDGAYKTFDFTVGEAASVEFSDMRIPTGEPTEVLFCVRDSNGLDITDIEKENCVITATKGTLNGFVLTLDEEISSEVTVTYTNPETKETFKSEGTITGIHNKAVSVTGCVIAKASESFLPDFSIISNGIRVGETDQKLYVQVKDSFDRCLLAGNNPELAVSYKSGATKIITVDEEGVLTPIKAGTANIEVSLKSDISVSYVFTVTVREKEILGNLIINISNGSLTNATEPSEQHRMNYPSINVIGKDQSNDDFPVDKLTFELLDGDDIIAYHGKALNASNKTIEITDGVTYFEPLKEGKVNFCVSKNTISTKGTLIIKEEDTAVAGYKIVGCKDVDVSLAWGEAGIAGCADHLELSLYDMNKDGFYINQIKCDGVSSKLVISPEGIELSLQENGTYLLSKDEVKGLQAGNKSITAFIGKETVATSPFAILDSLKPEVNLIKYQISGKLLNTETISQCFLLPEGYAVAGFSFTSSNHQVLDDAGTFVTETPYKAFYPNEKIFLSGLKLKILCPSGRSFFTEGLGIISVTPPVREITSYEKLMNCVKEVEAYTEDVLLQKTTASRSMLTEALEEAKKYLENIETGTAEAEETLTSALTKLKSAIEALKEKTATVILASTPKNAGELSGAGDYAVGDIVSISASALAGYTFDGWYMNGEKKADLPASFTITVTEAHTTLSYEARYVENTKMKLTVDNGKGTVLCEIDGTNETWTSMMTKEYALGTHIILTAQADPEKTFLYWVDQSDKVKAYSESFDFFITGHLQLKAVYKEQEENHCVVFKDINGKILSSQYISTGGSAKEPPHGNFIGYQFSGWDKALDNITQDLIITAVYDKMSGYTLEVTNGTIVDAKPEYTYGAFVTVKAEETKEDRCFSGWYLDNVTLVSDQTEYSFCLVESTKLTARFEGDSKLISAPRFFLTMSDRVKQTDGKHALQLNHTWSVPDGYRFLEAGLVFTLTEEKIDELKIETADGTDVYKKNPITMVKEGTYAYTLTLGPVSQQKNVYIKGYLMYREEESGKLITEYTSLFTSNANP